MNRLRIFDLYQSNGAVARFNRLAGRVCSSVLLTVVAGCVGSGAEQYVI